MTKNYEDFLKWNFYQIYPRSFKDANNDGIGDFQGIIQKIPHLAELGINAVWISPFFKSPNDDGGYDISDYYAVQDQFGTLADFKEMLDRLHENGIKLIVDLVVNHTSTAHKWFQEAKKSKNNAYRDYYYWADRPPTSWQSCFGGSAWQFDETTRQYYLHSFAVTQADLNWENPKVREEVEKIVDFWVDLGVDGFRCDVLDMISKDFEKGLNGNGPRLDEFIREIFGRETTSRLYTIGECWGVDEKRLYQLTAAERGELTASFLAGNITNCRGRFQPISPDFDAIHRYFTKYQLFTQQHGLIFAPFFENHDQGRCVSRFADDKKYRYESATFFATLLYTSRGTPFILQGQEFGTPNATYPTIKSFNDVETLNFYYSEKPLKDQAAVMRLVNFGTRDNGRRPMAWHGGTNGGFNDGATPWLPLHSDYKRINLEEDKKQEKSIFAYYKRLISLRSSTNALIYGEFHDLTSEARNYFAYSRTYGNETYVIVCNYAHPSKIALPKNLVKITSNYTDEQIGAAVSRSHLGSDCTAVEPNGSLKSAKRGNLNNTTFDPTEVKRGEQKADPLFYPHLFRPYESIIYKLPD